MNDIAILIVLMESIRAREGGEQRDCPEFEGRELPRRSRAARHRQFRGKRGSRGKCEIPDRSVAILIVLMESIREGREQRDCPEFEGRELPRDREQRDTNNSEGSEAVEASARFPTEALQS